MSSTKKNGKWHFGMKVHVGVDAESGLIHTLEASTAKVSDREKFHDLLHGEEDAVFGDKGYVSMEDKKLARDAGIYWGVLDRAGPHQKLSSKQKKHNKKLSSVRSKVEHPFQVMKHLWGHAKVRYRGIRKNCSQFCTLAALYNLYRVRKTTVLC